MTNTEATANCEDGKYDEDRLQTLYSINLSERAEVAIREDSEEAQLIKKRKERGSVLSEEFTKTEESEEIEQETKIEGILQHNLIDIGIEKNQLKTRSIHCKVLRLSADVRKPLCSCTGQLDVMVNRWEDTEANESETDSLLVATITRIGQCYSIIREKPNEKLITIKRRKIEPLSLRKNSEFTVTVNSTVGDELNEGTILHTKPIVWKSVQRKFVVNSEKWTDNVGNSKRNFVLLKPNSTDELFSMHVVDERDVEFRIYADQLNSNQWGIDQTDAFLISLTNFF